jgi:hypothetical protein
VGYKQGHRGKLKAESERNNVVRAQGNVWPSLVAYLGGPGVDGREAYFYSIFRTFAFHSSQSHIYHIHNREEVLIGNYLKCILCAVLK